MLQTHLPSLPHPFARPTPLRTTSMRTHNDKRQVLWARRYWEGQQGKYIGIALESGRLEVAVQTPDGLRWLPAAEALTTAEAQLWAAIGFRRRIR